MSEEVIQPRIDVASVVLLGSFNPAIFQPAWFKQTKLLNEKEADDANVEVIHRSVTAFSTDWLKLTVTLDRFNAQALSPTHFEAVRDLALGAFHLLEHTPVSAMGINRDMHSRLRARIAGMLWATFSRRKASGQGRWSAVATEKRRGFAR